MTNYYFENEKSRESSAYFAWNQTTSSSLQSSVEKSARSKPQSIKPEQYIRLDFNYGEKKARARKVGHVVIKQD